MRREGASRKLERDLHDGAQQHLIALRINLGLVRQAVRESPEEAAELLAQTEQTAAGALSALRDLVHGIYPPLLADHGLDAALAAHARKTPLPVTVEADGTGRYPQETEAAVYFAIGEALQNVAKYAQASRARRHPHGVLGTRPRYPGDRDDSSVTWSPSSAARASSAASDTWPLVSPRPGRAAVSRGRSGGLR